MRVLLSQGLSELGLDVSRAETLERFSSLLLEKNQVMNLTAITEPDAVAQLHLLDSAALLPFVDLTGKTVVDVGTGAGFPGMPLRILKDDFDLTLLDSLGKRVNWLQEVCEELQLKRVACVHARAEEFAMQHREQFDIATSRAVAQLSILSELCLPLIKVGGQFIAMKSVDTEDEIAAAKSAIKTLGGHIVKVEDYTIPTSDVVHRLVIVEKVSPTPRAYPRAFAKIKKVASRCDEQAFTSHLSHTIDLSERYDEEVLPLLDDALAGDSRTEMATQSDFFVVHLMGAHEDFKRRYPASFARFTAADETGGAKEDAASRQIRAEYDNAVLYDDHIVDAIIQRVEDQDAVVIFLSDHGEEVNDVRELVGHGDESSSWQHDVPMVIWTSTKFRANHAEDVRRIQAAKEHAWQSDEMIHTVLDLLKICVPQYEKEKSLLLD